MNITWLKKHDACPEGIQYWKDCGCPQLKEFTECCIRDKTHDYALWVMLNLMDEVQREQILTYAKKLTKDSKSNVRKVYANLGHIKVNDICATIDFLCIVKDVVPMRFVEKTDPTGYYNFSWYNKILGMGLKMVGEKNE